MESLNNLIRRIFGSNDVNRNEEAEAEEEISRSRSETLNASKITRYGAIALSAYGIGKWLTGSSKKPQSSGKRVRFEEEEERRLVRRSPRKQNDSGRMMGGFLAFTGVAALFWQALRDSFKDDSIDISKSSKEIKKDTEDFPVVGIDCQWIKHFSESRDTIGLLQISSYNGNVALIRLSKGEELPNDIKTILENTLIIKSGIDALKIARYLNFDYNIDVRGSFDLRYLVKDMAHQPESIAKLSKKILGREINDDLIASDWDVHDLSREQLKFAINSVKASIDIFNELIQYAVSSVNKDNILSYCSNKLDQHFIN